MHGGSHLFLASTPPAGSSIAQHGVQLVLFRARWALQDTVPPSWEVLVLGGGELPLLSARFYKETHLALLHGGGGSATTNKPSTTLSLRSYEELNFSPLRALGGGGSAGGGGAVASLHSRLLAMLEDGERRLYRWGRHRRRWRRRAITHLCADRGALRSALARAGWRRL